MSETLLILIFAFHLICMNLAAAGPLVCIWAEWTDGRLKSRGIADQLPAFAGRSLAGWALVALIVGTLLGVAQLLLVYDDQYRAILTQRLGSRVVNGVIELVFSLVLMLIHWLWWRASKSSGWVGRSIRILLLVLAGTNLLYHFPFLFALIANLSASGTGFGDPITNPEFRRLIMEPGVLSRSLHFVLASFAVCGMFWIVISSRAGKRPELYKDDAARLTRSGARLALMPTLAQIPVGFWVLLAMPKTEQLRLMGQDMPATALMGLSLVLAFFLMHQLAKLTTRPDTSPAKAILAMLLTIVLMSGVLKRSRNIVPPPEQPLVGNQSRV